MKILLIEDNPKSTALINHIVEDLKNSNNESWDDVHLECIPTKECVYGIEYDIILHGYNSLKMLHSLSLYDYLTGLYNRRGFFHFIEYQMKVSDRKHESFLLLYLDVDNFKKINDTRGHVVGDRVLHRVTKILKGAFRKSDIIARVGGDEFVVFPTEWDEEITIRNRLQEHVGMNNKINEIQIALSVGLVEYKPDGNVSVDSLLNLADKEMYKDKYSKK